MAGRKTLDIDYITLRNMRTVNPRTNLSPTANYILACDGSGTANWVNTLANIDTYGGITPQQKSFTMYLSYPAGFNNTITKVYVPPGLFSAPNLVRGATLTADDPSGSLTFYNQSYIDCSGLSSPFVTSFAVSGYLASGSWSAAPVGYYNPNTGLNYTSTRDYTVRINNLNLTYINGANTATYPTSGDASGYLATVTLNFA